MSKFKRETYTVDGVPTVVHSAGNGEPVVFFHGAGTVDGFDFAEPWTDRFKVIVPYHPGFCESGDDTSFTDLHDYVMHYLDLFDALRLDRGSGGVARTFAIKSARSGAVGIDVSAKRSAFLAAVSISDMSVDKTLES